MTTKSAPMVIDIWPQPPEYLGDTVKLSAKIVDQQQEQLLWFSMPKDIPLPEDHAHFLLGYLLVGMATGKSLRLHGRLSAALLRNIHELQVLFFYLFDKRYRPCSIEVDSYSEDIPRPEKAAISCYSGGVDSAFSAYQHAAQGAAKTPLLQACFMVHGFDIPLTDNAFELAYEKNQASLASLGLPLYAVKTNIRQLVSLTWDHNYGLAVAACMHLFKGRFSHGLIPSGFDYSAKSYSQGSNPITDHLLGQDSFQLVHDGARYVRSQKLNGIKDWPLGLANLRVCWQGAVKSHNCCRCEKCIRTMVNMKLFELDYSSAFPTPLDSARIRRLKLNKTGLVTWKVIIRQAQFAQLPGELKSAIYWMYYKALLRHRLDLVKWVRLKFQAWRRSRELSADPQA